MRYVLLMILSLGFQCEAQTYFNKRLDFNQSWGDYGWSVQVDSNNIWVVFGTLPNGGFVPPIATALLKLDFNGNVIDTALYTFPAVNVYPGGPGSLNKANDGFILGGSYEDSVGNGDALLIRIRSDGDTLWTKTFGDSNFQSGWMAKPSHDGGYLLCGQTTGNVTANPFNQDALLLKTDSTGNLLWQRNYGDSLGSELAFSFVETVNGGYALSGWRKLYDTTDMWIAIIDSSGIMQWDTIIRNPIQYDEGAWNIINTSDGNLLVTGFLLWQPQSPKPYYLKLDLNGNVIWNKTYLQAEARVQVFSTRELGDGSFISAGYHDIPPHPPQKGFLLKLSAIGDSLWFHEYYYGPNSTHHLNDVYPTPDGGFVACGAILVHPPDTGNQDLWILKVDSMGCEISNCTVSIDELHEKLNPLKAFPVPFTSELNVSIQKEFEGGEIKVFDSTGRLVFEKNLTSSEVKLNTAQWWEGIYLVQLVNESEVYTVKVIRAGN